MASLHTWYVCTVRELSTNPLRLSTLLLLQTILYATAVVPCTWVPAKVGAVQKLLQTVSYTNFPPNI